MMKAADKASPAAEHREADSMPSPGIDAGGRRQVGLEVDLFGGKISHGANLVFPHACRVQRCFFFYAQMRGPNSE